jgi:MFS family permease
VGLLGAAELAPIVVCGLYGGVLADRLDRRKVAVWSEAALGVIATLLAVNAVAWPVWSFSAMASAAGGPGQGGLCRAPDEYPVCALVRRDAVHRGSGPDLPGFPALHRLRITAGRGPGAAGKRRGPGA